ncbi:macrolide ABC transporter ATP-binding protein [Candidatus Pacearchaeota archaeon RBG_19FT_COMBO_34_9]|nr:MAG: macrolide ABC transporter ATP-binding protein [Candidatus Pacearchaeota archaeon RBG_19FT_COMBO_34_9]OGJ16270.1 MAG: macrolide ABC transporter ATP-binding protein [Candidatus Pacearchaeota archaeon RBG_13_33_26]
MTELIKLQNVCKDYEMGDSIVKAICNINLVIKQGEFIAILGPSGSGKSTMMNMVGALDLTTRGDIFLRGIDIEHISESELAQIRGKDIGFVFQTFNLIPTLTALENVMLPMLFHDYPRKERFERAEKLLERVGLSHRLSHFPNELSGGERQRVAIARALANEPKIILADEPTGNLDSKTGEEIITFFSELNKEGKTIIIVTHDNEVAKKAKRIIRIKDGQIIEDKFIKEKK